MSPTTRATTGDQCICCRNLGALPPATLNGKPVTGMPGLVDGAVAQQCCDQCLTALFLSDGTYPHPHPLDVPAILRSRR